MSVTVAHWTVVAADALDDGGQPMMDALMIELRDGLARTARAEGLQVPRSYDVRVECETAEHRALRQQAADEQADAERIERWTVPRIVTVHAEGRTGPVAR